VSDTLGKGHIVSWEGGFLLIGRVSRVAPMHAHYAIQVAFGTEHGVRFRASDDDPWVAYDGVVIASRQPHTMDATHVSANVVLFVEPETREGRALAERYGDQGIAALSADDIAAARTALFAAWREERSLPAVIAASQAVVASLTAGIEPSVVSDERILRATAYIKSQVDRSLTLEDVAEPVPASVRGADRDGAAALHPLATLPSRVGAAHRRRVAVVSRAFGGVRRCRAPDADLPADVRIPSVGAAVLGALADGRPRRERSGGRIRISRAAIPVERRTLAPTFKGAAPPFNCAKSRRGNLRPRHHDVAFLVLKPLAARLQCAL